MSTILIVDDDLMILNYLEDILCEAGHAVVAAQDGHAAIEHFSAGKSIDLVITDYKMHGMNGLELIAALKGIAPSVPVILTSIFARTDIYLKAIALGVAEFLEKPVRPDALKRIVGEILDVRSGQSAQKLQ